MAARKVVSRLALGTLLLLALAAPGALSQEAPPPAEEAPPGGTPPPAGGEGDVVVNPPGEGSDVTIVENPPPEASDVNLWYGLAPMTWLLIGLVVLAIVALVIWALTRPARTTVVEDASGYRRVD